MLQRLGLLYLVGLIAGGVLAVWVLNEIEYWTIVPLVSNAVKPARTVVQ